MSNSHKNLAGAVLAFVSAAYLVACGAVAPSRDAETNAARLARIDAMYQDYRKEFPGVNEVTPHGALDLQKSDGAVLVDVRTPEEQAVSMLPGAITQADFEAARDQYRDKTIVTYCTIGARSGEYAEKLQADGMDVYNLKGSILAWTHAKLPLVDGEGHETHKIHTYGQEWDLAAEGYEATW
jgi:rhodanese-related sulfurtransferase